MWVQTSWKVHVFDLVLALRVSCVTGAFVGCVLKRETLRHGFMIACSACALASLCLCRDSCTPVALH